jgi:enterochelin esterase-like enzyme
MSTTGPALHPALPRASTVRTLAVTAVVLAWLIVGLVGAFRYVDHYSLYRGFSPPHTPKGTATGTVQKVRLWSPALAQSRDARVYLPPGYAAAAAHGRRFPVLYLLHGHPGRPENLFQAGALAPDADVLIAQHRIRPMIVVAPNGRDAHGRITNEWANGRAGRYESYVLDVVRAIDRRYATIPDRAHRAIGGLSEGGYAAANLTLRHLGVFGGFQSWSGYFVARSDGTFHGASQRVLEANSPARYLPRMAARIRRVGVNAYVYVGKSDRYNRANSEAFSAQLAADGVHVHEGVFPGGHDWGLWRSQLPHMLRVANGWFGATAKGAHR